jgi:Ca-activated chloride channel family protein
MRVRYLDWREGSRRFADRLKLLKRLFAFLLVREDGDVERALELLEAIGKRHGLFDEDLSFEEFKRQLLEERLVAQSPQGFSLTPRGERFVRTESLDQIFSGLKLGAGGEHRTPFSGQGRERLAETRPYLFGDDVAEIDFVRSYQNAFRRAGEEGLALEEADLEVFESERHVSVATALLVDVSHSMILYGEDRITPAKRVALALAELILSRYPKDALHVILFGDDAREISVRELTYAGVGPYHTNTQAGLRLARRILMRKKHSNRQVFMITDGKPTALFEEDGLYLNSFGLDRKIVNKTLDEAAECRRHGIPITTFMLARDPHLVRFVETLTKVNRGRAYFAAADRLEQTVFVDFIRNRRRLVR